MANTRADAVRDNGSDAGQAGTDRHLLERFLAHRDESAFAALVRRHSRTVWGVCRRVLHQQQEAEDAFQATFLVLARKAASIRKGEALGSWLYGVAYRTALKARRGAESGVADAPDTAGPKVPVVKMSKGGRPAGPTGGAKKATKAAPPKAAAAAKGKPKPAAKKAAPKAAPKAAAKAAPKAAAGKAKKAPPKKAAAKGGKAPAKKGGAKKGR